MNLLFTWFLYFCAKHIFPDKPTVKKTAGGYTPVRGGDHYIILDSYSRRMQQDDPDFHNQQQFENADCLYADDEEYYDEEVGY